MTARTAHARAMTHFAIDVITWITRRASGRLTSANSPGFRTSMALQLSLIFVVRWSTKLVFDKERLCEESSPNLSKSLRSQMPELRLGRDDVQLFLFVQ